jgi:hypothetical protein
MGNHDVGRALAAAAKGFWRGRTTATKEDALGFLDEVASLWRGADAEFDDELLDGITTPLGRLVALAFDATPEEAKGEEDEETYECAWFEGPYTRFRRRYEFC